MTQSCHMYIVNWYFQFSYRVFTKGTILGCILLPNLTKDHNELSTLCMYSNRGKLVERSELSKKEHSEL